jgi:hypothetical protein
MLTPFPRRRLLYPSDWPCHPSDNLSSLDALLDALVNLDDLFAAIDGAYAASLAEDKYERWDEQS